MTRSIHGPEIPVGHLTIEDPFSANGGYPIDQVHARILPQAEIPADRENRKRQDKNDQGDQQVECLVLH